MALSFPGIRSNKKKHINGGSSARMAGIVCANVDQIRRHGRWSDTTMNGAYLTSLCKKLFPAKELSPDNNDPIQPTVAANAFLLVIMMLRKTFIQDSVLMMERHPCHLIKQHSIFSDPAYLSFKRDVLQIEAQENDPADDPTHTLLQQCVPMHSIFQTPTRL